MARSKSTRKPAAPRKAADEPAEPETAETTPAATEPEQDAGKATAEANAEQLDETTEPDDGRDIDALREERAQLLKDIAELEEKKTERARDEADEAGLHEAKVDDQGALEQQAAARDSGVELYDRLGILTGPPVVAPILEESTGSLKVVSRREGEELEEGVDYAEVDRARFVGFNLHLIGEDFPFPGEVVIDIRRKDGQDHQRYSVWTDDGNVDCVLPGINGTGDWLVHAETLITQVGEGRDDRLPLIKETEPVSIQLY